MTSGDNVIDLLIIGAGPTGLSAALLAQMLGLKVQVIDRAQECIKVGRADALNSRSQDYLAIMGVLEEMIDIGLKCNTNAIFADGEFLSHQQRLWTSLKHVSQPNFLFLGQADILQIISRHLDDSVRYNACVTDIYEYENSVRVHVGDQVYESKYVFAADGARSFVRNWLKIPFNGTTSDMVWTCLDAFIETDFPTCSEIITFQKDNEARVSWMPREREKLARFYVRLDAGVEINEKNVHTEICKFLKPYRIDFLQTEWFSKVEIKERVAETYFSPLRRIILGGDAAHAHSFHGAQGMNTGISDAFALIWRLNLMLQLGSRLDPVILKSYESERRQVAVNVIELSGKLARITSKKAQEYLDHYEANSGFVTGAGIQYPNQTPLVQGSACGIFTPGKRCPDIFLRTSDASTCYKLYSLVSYGKFTVLCMDSTECTMKIGSPMVEFVDFWHIHSHQAIQTCSRLYHRAFLASNQETLFPKFAVVRPDMYIGYIGDDAQSYLNGFIDTKC